MILLNNQSELNAITGLDLFIVLGFFSKLMVKQDKNRWSKIGQEPIKIALTVTGHSVLSLKLGGLWYIPEKCIFPLIT